MPGLSARSFYYEIPLSLLCMYIRVVHGDLLLNFRGQLFRHALSRSCSACDRAANVTDVGIRAKAKDRLGQVY